MKRFCILILAILFTAPALRAQEPPADTLWVPAALDSTLVGKDIVVEIQSGGSTVYQSAAVRDCFARYVRQNAYAPISGYRIRVYFDSDRTSRGKSDLIARTIAKRFPGLGVYRTYDNPNFKVTVGDFRTRDEALRLYQELRKEYPSSFIVKENIHYPLVDTEAIFE